MGSDYKYHEGRPPLLREQPAGKWRRVVGFPSYLVSSDGHVKSLPEGKQRQVPERILRPADNGNGYLFVLLRKNGKTFNKRIHNLVAEAFVPRPLLPQLYVMHKNGDRADNRATNLAWGTKREVMLAAHKRATWKVTLTLLQCLEIRKRRAAGDALGRIAKAYGVSSPTIARICRP